MLYPSIIFKECIYSNRLIQKIEKINKAAGYELVDIPLIKKAIGYAQFYHANQFRESGEAYYSHPLEVAYMTADYLPETDMIITAILHDTLEDTKLTLMEITNVFGENIANHVTDLTRIKDDNIKISSSKLVENLWRDKKYKSLLIKQLDRLHNIRTITAKSNNKIRKIATETLHTFVVLAAYLKTADIEYEFAKTCISLLGYDPLASSLESFFEDDQNHLAQAIQNNRLHKYNKDRQES